MRTVPVGTTPFGDGTESMIDYRGTSIQPLFIEPGVNLALSDPSAALTEIPLVYTNGFANMATYGWPQCFGIAIELAR